MNIEKLTIGNTLQVEIHQPYEKMTCYWQRVNFLAYLQGIFYYTVGNKKRIHKSKNLKPIELNHNELINLGFEVINHEIFKHYGYLGLDIIYNHENYFYAHNLMQIKYVHELQNLMKFNTRLL